MPWTVQEQEKLEHLNKQVLSRISGQNWSDTPISEKEKNLIEMAVRSTCWILLQEGKLSKLVDDTGVIGMVKKVDP